MSARPPVFHGYLPKGICCPECGVKDYRLVKRYPRRDGTEYVRYECRACLKRFNTEQRLVRKAA